MKKLYVILAAALAFAACSKETAPELVQDSGEKAAVTFQVKAPVSKAVAVNADNEKNVKTIQVFVFKSDGSVDQMSARTTESSVTLACGLGERTVCALVNAPEVTVSTTYTLARLQSITSSFTDNASDAFVMYGEMSTKLTARAIVTVPVKRNVCKVVIKKITRDFDQTNFAADNDTEMNITGIYLKHVAGQYKYSGTTTVTTWYNNVENTHETNAKVVAMIADYGIAGVALKNGESYETEHSFYAYPNADSESPTLLTVETTFKGSTLYYPLGLPVLERNKVYTISLLTLSRPGGAYDDRDTIMFYVEVEDWEETEPWEETY